MLYTYIVLQTPSRALLLLAFATRLALTSHLGIIVCGSRRQVILHEAKTHPSRISSVYIGPLGK